MKYQSYAMSRYLKLLQKRNLSKEIYLTLVKLQEREKKISLLMAERQQSCLERSVTQFCSIMSGPQKMTF